MSGVQVSLSDFPDDIVEPMTPILEAIGLVELGDDNVDINGWDLQKALGFLASYQRTTALLSIVDFIDKLPAPMTKYRDLDGHVTDDSSPDSIEEKWYKVFDFDVAKGQGSLSLTLHREKKSLTLTADPSQNCQVLYIGIGVEILGIDVGTSLELDLNVSIPVVRIESFADGTVAYKVLFLSGDTTHAFSTTTPMTLHQVTGFSIQAGLRNRDFTPLATSSGQQCSAVGLRCSISPSGVDVDLFLDDFMGSPSALPQDMTIGVASPGAGFSPDWNQIVELLLNSAPAGIIQTHLLPLLGLVDGPNSAWDLPRLNLLDIVSNLSNGAVLRSMFRDWLLEIIDNTTNLNIWLNHFKNLIGGVESTTPSTIVGGTNGNGVVSNPYELTIFTQGSFSAKVLIWKGYDENGVLSSLHLGFSADVGINLGSILNGGIGLNTHLLEFRLSGDNVFNILPGLSLALNISKSDESFLLDLDTDDFGPPFDSIKGGDIEVQDVSMGVELDENRQFRPYCLLTDVTIGSDGPKDIDLLSSNLAEDILEPLLTGIRDAVSEILSVDPILQRVGSLIGLVAPRGGNVQTLMWEGASSQCDLRIGGGATNFPTLMDMVNNPIQAIGRYHRELLKLTALQNPSTELAAVRPWSLIAEALQDLVHSLFEMSRGNTPIPIRGHSDALATGVVHELDTGIDIHTIQLTQDDFVLPISLDFNFESATDLFSLIPFIGMNNLKFGKKIVLDVGLYAPLLSVTLPPSTSTGVEWLPNANLDLTLKGPVNGTSNDKIRLFSLGPIELSLDSVSAGLEWQRQPSEFGYYANITNLEFGGSLPNMSKFFTDLDLSLLPVDFTISDLQGFSWNGLSLCLPDGSYIQFAGRRTGWFDRPDGAGGLLSSLDLNSITWPLDLAGHLNISNLPSIELSGNGSMFSVSSWDLRSLDFPTGDFDLSSIISSLFTLNSSNAGTWTIQDFINLPVFRNLVGQFLTLRCGKFGFFVSGFLKIDPNFSLIDLGTLMKSGGFEPPEFHWPDLPDIWKLYYGVNDDSFGLGPFALPFDWPQIDFDDLLDNPLAEIKRFMLALFQGSSSSGEPFAFPALRWINGLFSGSLPDLRLPDLGWSGGGGNRKKGGLGNKIQIPNIPLKIGGMGTYNNPWVIQLSVPSLSKLELLFWLDPDGLPREEIDEVFSHISSDVMSLIEDVVSGVFSATDSPSLPIGWDGSLAAMIYRLASLDKRAAHAVGHLSLDQLTDIVGGFDAYMRHSDGLIPSLSQSDPFNDWSNQDPNGIHEANHLNSLRTPSIIAECANFINATLAGSTETWSIVFVAPEWMGANAFDTFATDLSTNLSLSTSSVSVIDLRTQGPFMNPSSAIIDLSSFVPSKYNHLIPCLELPSSGSYGTMLAKQLHEVVEHVIANQGGKVFVIGHSVGGLSVRYYTQGKATVVETSPGIFEPQIPVDSVLGAFTISTPHDSGRISEHTEGDAVLRFMHLLRLMGAIDPTVDVTIDPNTTPLTLPTGTNNKKNLTPEFLKQLSKLSLEGKMKRTNPEVDE